MAVVGGGGRYFLILFKNKNYIFLVKKKTTEKLSVLGVTVFFSLYIFL